jgi:hypothetical protein
MTFEGLLAKAALGPKFVETNEEAQAAGKSLVERMRSAPSEPADGVSVLQASWDELLDSGLIPDHEKYGLPPCSGRIIWVDVEGSREPVATLETVFEANLTFEAAKKFCDPEEWPCFPLWCPPMKVLPPRNGVLRYQETVSADCKHKDDTLTFVVDLDVVKWEEDGPPRAAGMEYRLGAPNQDVSVNEGSLEVVELATGPNPRVRVISTKRIKFRGLLDVPGIAYLMCYIGYLSWVEDLLCCAADPKGKAPSPAEAPARAEKRNGGGTRSMIDEVATTLVDCIDDWGGYKPSGGKVRPARRTPDAVMQEMADTWVRAMRQGPRLSDAGRPGGTGGARGRRPSGGARPASRPGTAGASRGTRRAAPAQSAYGEIVEGYGNVAKDLIVKWQEYASHVASRLDAPRGYDADSATSDVAAGISLATQTGARMMWGAVETASICFGLELPYIVESEEFSARLEGATLQLQGDLVNGFGEVLRKQDVWIVSTRDGPGLTTFVLRADATGLRAGTYKGVVLASTSTTSMQVSVRILVP